MVIEVELAGCVGAGPVWARLLAALRAPDWHGANLDALWDGLTGGILAPPAAISVKGRGDAAAEAAWARIAGVLAEAGVAVHRRDG